MSLIDSSRKIDIRTTFTTRAKPRDFIIPGLIPGIVGSIVAPGSTGKSFLGIQLAIAVAGVDRWGFTENSGKSGKVLYFSIEDGYDEIHNRHNAITDVLESMNDPITDAEIDLLVENLTMRDLLSATVMPDFLSPKIYEKWLNNEGFEESRTVGEAWIDDMIHHGKDHRLIIIDTLRNSHNGDENNGGQMAELLSRLRRVAISTGAAVLFLHHTNKTAPLNGSGDLQQASRGSSVLTDNVRYQANMATLTEEEARGYARLNPENHAYYVRFIVSKANYCAPQPERLFKRESGGCLTPVYLEKKSEEKTDKVLKTKEKYNIGENW